MDKSTSTSSLFPPGTNENPHQTVLEVSKCPVQAVTVYQDRAEVTRLVTLDLKNGTTSVTVSGLSRRVDWDSVRVVGGVASATLLEVSHAVNYQRRKTEEADKTQKALEDVKDRERKVIETRARVERESDWLNAFATSMLGGVDSSSTSSSESSAPSYATKKRSKDYSPPPISSSAPVIMTAAVVPPVLPTLFTAEFFDGTSRFLDFYQDRLEKIDNKLAQCKRDLDELAKEKTRLESTIRSGSLDQVGVHEVTIFLHTESPGPVGLHLAYLISGAKWSASYDVRVDSGASKIELTYYGNITNSSEEDWENAIFSLSTAVPSSAGKPPTLYTSFVKLKGKFNKSDVPYSSKNLAPQRQMMVQQQVQQQVMVSNAMLLQPQRLMNANEAPDFADDVDSDERGPAMGGTSASFLIPRKSTILSDDKPHKVTIRIINMDATFTYTVLPRLTEQAYLKASVVNKTPDTPYLAGEISVFMDNNFVAKSDINTVAPGESFAVFLGVDQGIKVEYRPVKEMKDTSGLFSKSSKKTVNRRTVLTNNKPGPVTVVMFEQLPKSTDSSITVKLVEPRMPEEGTEDDVERDLLLTPANNLRWKFDIPPGKKHEVPLSYTLEWSAEWDIQES